MKFYTTREAAKLIGIGFRTLNRWIAAGRIKPSQSVQAGTREMFLWTESEIAAGRKIKATLKPGRQPKGQK